ncbi:MAG TPA: alpha/beta hydrolase fold domain-containing protein [Phenylobacterium sp.]|uniref:alpha/beta hydrolase n=1 Tax=Phenylobacterium sp. TaxID=1871053 RepID=UPI002B4968D8|nr:alpha/beta hydrolase fold domain-containing protein [Phenylobacterium sp.]HKR90141.1 alpha/beta hydrolase fold domain-containing protein [Phenylobacterium sp.]
MSFDDLPPRPEPIFEVAKVYARTVLQRSREAAESGSVKFFGDLAYGPDYYQRVDVYAPLEASRPLPVLIFLHGGAFIGGYKEWMGFMAPAIVSTPAVFVSVSYRLAPEHPFPAPVEDTAAAVDWTQRNIARFGGDPDRMLIGGHSAGGNLAALVALDRRWLARYGSPGNAIKGALIVSAPLDMRYDENDPADAKALAMRRTFAPRDADIPLVSPLARITADAPPFHVSAGEADLWSLAEESRIFSARLRDVGAPTVHEIYAGHDHFATSSRCVEDQHPWLRHAQAFLRTGSPHLG